VERVVMEEKNFSLDSEAVAAARAALRLLLPAPAAPRVLASAWTLRSSRHCFSTVLHVSLILLISCFYMHGSVRSTKGMLNLVDSCLRSTQLERLEL
jgi:hypothetical protein